VILGAAARLSDGRFQFTISAEPGYNYDIQASTNLIAWATIATLPNPTGLIQFIDPDAAHYTSRCTGRLEDWSLRLRGPSPACHARATSFHSAINVLRGKWCGSKAALIW